MKGIELRDPINDNRSNSRWTQAEGSGLDVLLAEDDPVNRLLLKTVLKKSGHRVSEVETLRDLIAAATQATGRPGAIVTDLSMPGGSGLDALSAIRDFERSNRLAEVPIIVVTGSAGPRSERPPLMPEPRSCSSNPPTRQSLRNFLRPTRHVARDRISEASNKWDTVLSY